MNSTIFHQDQIIQLELLRYEQLTNQLLIGIISIVFLIIVGISGFAYYYFDVDIMIVIVGFLLLMASSLFVLSQYQTYFYTDSLTLVIAFGEFQLMNKTTILWQEKIEQLVFQYNEGAPNEIPIIMVKGTSFSLIHIGYGRPKSNHSNTKIDYLVFSKLDWNILKKYAQTAQVIKYQNKKLIKN
jgi:hypothetical protein